MNLNTPFGSRPPNEHELFYTAVAANLSKLCEKISKRALVENGPNLTSTEWQVSYERSECYYYAAFKTKDESLCDSVNKVITLPSNASDISGSACHEVIHNHRVRSDEPTLPYSSIGSLLKEMRYKDEDRYAAEYAENPINSSIGHFYETIWNTEAFKVKVRNLPSYDEPYSAEKLRPANGDEILTAQLAAGDSIPELCAKISPNSYKQGPTGLRWNVPLTLRLALRNSCWFDVAQNTRNSSFCRKMEPLPPSQKDCESQLKIQARDKSLAFQYSATFSTMKTFADELRKLGYAEPFIIDEKTMDWSRFYLYVLFSAPQETKMEFLRRAANLPSFKK